MGQARQWVAPLDGQADARFVTLKCHGDAGRIVLPRLGDEVDRHQPLHGSVGPQEVRSFARPPPGAVVISTGCDTGNGRARRSVSPLDVSEWSERPVQRAAAFQTPPQLSRSAATMGAEAPRRLPVDHGRRRVLACRPSILGRRRP